MSPRKNRDLASMVIKDLRELAGLTQKELADLAGVSEAYLSKVETGKEIATRRYVWTVISALSASMNPASTKKSERLS